ncbi:hypothetical protein ACHAWC_007164 [Mediolabrus comicus]
MHTDNYLKTRNISCDTDVCSSGSERDGEWWHNNNTSSGDAQKSATASSGANLQASNERFGTRSRFSRAKAGDALPQDESSVFDDENEETRPTRSLPIQMWERFKLTPTRKKIKRFIAGMVLFTALKSIYFADLDDYQYSQKGLSSYTNHKTNTKQAVSTKMDSGLPSLRSNTDGVKSLSELLGDDYLGGSSKKSEGNNMMGNSMTDSLGQSNLSSFGKRLESSTFNTLPESRADTILQNNFVSSKNNFNTMRSDSYNSFDNNGKSMSEIFGSDVTGMKSSSVNSFGGKSMSEALDSVGQHGFTYSDGTNMKSSPFNSYSNPENSVQSQLSSFPKSNSHSQSPNNEDSIGQSFQGLRGQSMDMGNTNNFNTDNSEATFRTGGKSMFASAVDGFSSNQSSNAQISMGNLKNNPSNSMHTGLQCESYGGPQNEAEYSDLIYWRDIPSDAAYFSPNYNAQIQESKNAGSFNRIKYLTFEMDGSGWNNIRLGFENMILLAHSMGRTLVMPPKRQIAHGMPDTSGRKIISFDDFYNIDAINAKHKGLNIISMDEFLEREALNGHLKSMSTGEVVYPPNNQVNWNNQRLDPLWNYISTISRTFSWNPKECVLAFPAKGTDEQHLFSMMADVLIEKDGRPFPDYSEFQGRPIDVDAPTTERFREVLAGRRKICMYDSKMHMENDVVHFKAEETQERMIQPFYSFIFWEDWRQQLWALRFIRDKLVYKEEIVCLAARMISAMREYVRQRTPENTKGLYDAIHIRRGDFQSQFPNTEMTASTILAGIQDSIAPGSTLYISTDERNPTFFDPLREVYDIKFIGDFGELLSGINPQFFGLAEQLVASRARVFYGTYYSTFSAYIVRLRGYYSVKENQPGHMSGSLQNTYFLPTQWKNEMATYQAIHVPFYAREFPIAWRDIDRL